MGRGFMSDKDKDNDKVEETENSRRNFLKNSGLALGGLAVGGAFGGVFVNNRNRTDEKTEQTRSANPNEALMFFTPDEFQATIAASDRIFPADDLGPGAAEIGRAHV